MKKQTGWAECPRCKGTGEQETEESKKIREPRRRETENLMISIQFNMANAKGFLEKLKVLNSEPVDFKYEPCSTCKDSKFKGLLPIY